MWFFCWPKCLFPGWCVGGGRYPVHPPLRLPSLLQPDQQPGGAVRPNLVRTVRVQLPRLGRHLLPRQGADLLEPGGGPPAALLCQGDSAAPLDSERGQYRSVTRVTTILPWQVTLTTKPRVRDPSLSNRSFFWTLKAFNESVVNLPNFVIDSILVKLNILLIIKGYLPPCTELFLTSFNINII